MTLNIKRDHSLYIKEFIKVPNLFQDFLFGNLNTTLCNPQSTIKIENNEIIGYKEVNKDEIGYEMNKVQGYYFIMRIYNKL